MAKILIVEDQKTMRELIKMTLEAEGHQVTMAGDGVEAMEVVRGATFDLVISDVNMPNMGGISFVSKLKRLDDYKFTPVLMLTTETSQYKKIKLDHPVPVAGLQSPLRRLGSSLRLIN